MLTKFVSIGSYFCTVWLVVFRKSMSIFEIEIASIRKSMSIFEIEIASIFSLFAIWFCIIYLALFFVRYGWLYSESSYGRTDRVVKH